MQRNDRICFGQLFLIFSKSLFHIFQYWKTTFLGINRAITWEWIFRLIMLIDRREFIVNTYENIFADFLYNRKVIIKLTRSRHFSQNFPIECMKNFLMLEKNWRGFSPGAIPLPLMHSCMPSAKAHWETRGGLVTTLDTSHSFQDKCAQILVSAM